MQATNHFMASNKNLADKLKSIESNESMEEINLDRSMSKSIEEALFYQPLKSTQQSKTTASATSVTSSKTTAATATASSGSRDKQVKIEEDSQNTSSVPGSNDSSILKLNSENDSQVSSTCSNSMVDNDDISILPSSMPNGKTPTHFMQSSSLNVDSPFRGISLKDFETHRKMIEEQNRQKKDLLYKVIEQQ